MDGCATNFDGDFWIENAYSGLEGFKGSIFVREDTKYAGFNTEANACKNVFLCGLEPGVALGLDGQGSEECVERAEGGRASVGSGVAWGLGALMRLVLCAYGESGYVWLLPFATNGGDVWQTVAEHRLIGEQGKRGGIWSLPA